MRYAPPSWRRWDPAPAFYQVSHHPPPRGERLTVRHGDHGQPFMAWSGYDGVLRELTVDPRGFELAGSPVHHPSDLQWWGLLLATGELVARPYVA